MPQAHSGGNQAKDNTFADSAGAPGEAGNVTGGSLDIENYCTLRSFFDLATLAGLSPQNLPEAGIRLLFMIKLFNYIVFITAFSTVMKNEFTFHLIWNCLK